ncbi:MAG: AI-2E family transporter [Ruminococcaceae bacterium]|nr:AI-2E family transporter [Oscillospiraceae bacterium]
MTGKVKKHLLLITFGVALFALLNNIGAVLSFAKKIVSLCLPLLLGLLFAFILNVPMRGFEKILDKISSKTKTKFIERSKYLISLLLSIACIILVLVIAFTIAIPKIAQSLRSIVEIVDAKIPEFLIWLEQNGVDTTKITEKMSNFNFEEIFKHLTQGAVTIFLTAFDATMLAVKAVTTTILALIIAIYLLLDKKHISSQVRKLCNKIFSEKRVEGIYKHAYLIRDTFAKFLSGQCLEACILAFLIFILFIVFGLPHATLIALLAAVLSFIPYFGSFVACFIGTFLTLIVAPEKAILCLAVYLGAQLIEQHFIYPHVVGSSVGLSPFYTIIAVLLGGNLFGIFGMLLFIPLFSVIYTVVSEYANSEKSSEENCKMTDSKTDL